MKKYLITPVLLAVCLLLAGCTDKKLELEPLDTYEADTLIDADTGEAEETAFDAVLYFRYADTDRLGMQVRPLSYSKTGSPEKAVIEALLAGPDLTANGLYSVFPDGTVLRSVRIENGTAYIALDGDMTEERLWREALAASMTENGLCSEVCILPSGERFTREESVLLTPRNCIILFMEAWKKGERDEMFSMLPNLPAGEDDIPALIGYAVSDGNPAPDGQRMFFTVETRILKNGVTADRKIPVCVKRENGRWIVTDDSLSALWQQ